MKPDPTQSRALMLLNQPKLFSKSGNSPFIRAMVVAVLGLTMIACASFMPATPGADASPTAVVLTASIPVATSAVASAQQPTPMTEALLLPLTPGDPALAMLPAARQEIDRLAQAPRYLLALQIDPSLSSFVGQAHILYTNQENVTLDEIYLRLLPNGKKSYGGGSLTVSQIQVDGASALTELSGSDTILKISLPVALPPGGQIELTLAFQGIIPLDFGGESAPAGYGIYNLSDGVLTLSGWYPILAVYDAQGWNLDPVSELGDSVYSDTAFYTVRICAPQDLAVAATGVQTAQQLQDELACQDFESGATRDFFIAASRKFTLLSREVDGVTINSYYLPGHETAAQLALDVSADSLQVYNQKFGAYPYPELDVIDAPMRNALGVEYPGIILVASSLYEMPEQPDFTVATAHEVAHQWWYGVVGNDVFDEPWLDEGLTTYSSSLYYEFAQSPGAAQGLLDYWRQRYERQRQEIGDERVTASLGYFESLDNPRFYGGIVYIKAALFFDALRQKIGDRAFFAALQAYYQAKKYDIATAQDLLSAFETASGAPLDDFYQQWLYSAE